MMALAVVERPEPLRPSRATISPGRTSMSTPCNMALAVEGVQALQRQHGGHACSPCCASTEPR